MEKGSPLPGNGQSPELSGPGKVRDASRWGYSSGIVHPEHAVSTKSQVTGAAPAAFGAANAKALILNAMIYFIPSLAGLSSAQFLCQASDTVIYTWLKINKSQKECKCQLYRQLDSCAALRLITQ